DGVNLSDFNAPEGLARTANQAVEILGKIRMNCAASSPAAIAMAEVARRECLLVEYDIGEVDNERQISKILDTEPEIAVIANAGYYSSLHNRIRTKYVNYCPLHPSRDVIYQKCISGQTKAPRLRRLFILSNTSGLEPKRMGHSVEGIQDIEELHLTTAAEIAN